MKKWLVLFVVSLYMYMPAISIHLHTGFLFLAIILTLVSGFLNIANAVKMQHNPNDEMVISMKIIMILKLCLLPLYAAYFITFAGSISMALSIWFTIPVFFALPGAIPFSYFVLFVSSSLAVSRIIIHYRNGVLSIGQCVINIILQLFIMLDVIGSIIVYMKEHKNEKQQGIKIN